MSEWKAVPVTSLPGLELHPALSPDGRRLAFVWDGPERNNFDVYVKEIGSEEMVRLTKDPAPDHHPVWSPDGRYIAFLRQQGIGAGVFVVPAGGGQEHKLADITEVLRLYTEAQWSPGCDWSPDGRFLAVPGRSPDGKNWSIYSVSVETGQKQLLTTSDSPGVMDFNPAFSPDGSMLAFLRAFPTESVLLIQPLSREGTPAAQTKPVGRGNWLFTTVSWLPGGRELLLSADFAEGQARRFSVTGSHSRGFRLPARDPSLVQISLRGTRLVFTDVEALNRFFRVSLAGTGRDQPAPFLSSTRGEESAAFSPDGQKVAFTSWRSGAGLIWICNIDGSGCHELSSFHGGAHGGSPSWSPDGRRLAFDAVDGRGWWHVYISAAEGGAVRRLTSDRTFDARPRWSRDGQWIYFGSTRSGEWEIWKTRADSAEAGATAIRITRKGGIEAAESADGRYLYYTKRGTSGIWRLLLGGSGDVREEKVLDLGGEGFWSLRPDGIFVLDAGLGRPPAIRFFEFATGRLSEIVTLPAHWSFVAGGGALVVSPDGQWAVVTRFGLVESDIMLVENFR